MEPSVGSKKELAVALSKLAVFSNPKVRLEQYPTDSEVAADVLWNLMMTGNLQDKKAVDLGCGTGILGIGALLCGCDHTTFIDIDESALDTLKSNLHKLDIDEKYYKIIQQDLTESTSLVKERFDIAIMNPPFGTRNEHADLLFLEKACSTAPLICSMHKTSTMEYVRGWLEKKEMDLVRSTKYDFPIKQTFLHQKKKIHRIEVTCIIAQKLS